MRLTGLHPGLQCHPLLRQGTHLRNPHTQENLVVMGIGGEELLPKDLNFRAASDNPWSCLLLFLLQQRRCSIALISSGWKGGHWGNPVHTHPRAMARVSFALFPRLACPSHWSHAPKPILNLAIGGRGNAGEGQLSAACALLFLSGEGRGSGMLHVACIRACWSAQGARSRQADLSKGQAACHLLLLPRPTAVHYASHPKPSP